MLPAAPPPAPAPVARQKRRIAPVRTAAAPPTAAAPAAAAATPAPTMPRTLQQLKAEVQKDAQTLADAAAQWTEATHAELVHADPEDLTALTLAASKLGRTVAAYQGRARAEEEAALAAEERRRSELKPVPIDKREVRLYRKHKAKLTGGNTVLYKCPQATGAECVCTAGPVPFGPGLNAIVGRHIARVHLKSAKKRKDLHGLGDAVAEGWVVA